MGWVNLGGYSRRVPNFGYRMVNLNMYPTNIFTNDATSNGGTRLILQALLYAAGKIN